MLHGPQQRNRWRAGALAVAAGLVLFTPLLASARLRSALLGERSVATAHLTSMSTPRQSDIASAQTLLARLRGSNAFVCELALINVDHRNWFGGLSNQISDSPLIDDSTQITLPEELRSPDVLDFLLRGVRDSDACVRRAAASLLGRTTSPGTPERLQGLLSDADVQTRALAAFAVGLAEQQSASARLLSLLDDRAPVVRASAAWALGRLEHRPAIEKLSELLTRDVSASVRRAAARALGDITG